MKRRILKAISLICTCVVLLTLAACGEESQDNTGKYIVFKFGNDNIYLDEVGGNCFISNLFLSSSIYSPSLYFLL